VKEKLNKDMESLKKKNQTETLETESSLSQIKNTVESHSSRGTSGSRTSGLQYKIDTKEKNQKNTKRKG
jgi:hypothetical protein